MWHKIEHYFGWIKGRPDAFYEGDKLMMSFKCGKCGKREGIFPCDNIIDNQINLNKNYDVTRRK
jgi:hypothetical protein